MKVILVLIMLKEKGDRDVSLSYPLYNDPKSWRKRHPGFYDAEYQLVQPE